MIQKKNDAKHKTSIRMSKTARSGQTTAAKTNWTNMAKWLFQADTDEGRHDVLVRMHLQDKTRATEEHPSYNTDQLQYILMVMLALTTAEKRTQEMYQRDFSQRCDKISATHGLAEDQYWIDGKVPEEWHKLDQEFEQRSFQILLDTLREYAMDDLADHVETTGAPQFLEIIGNIEPQFTKVLTRPIGGLFSRSLGERGSIPETLQTILATNKL